MRVPSRSVYGRDGWQRVREGHGCQTAAGSVHASSGSAQLAPALKCAPKKRKDEPFAVSPREPGKGSKISCEEQPPPRTCQSSCHSTRGRPPSPARPSLGRRLGRRRATFGNWCTAPTAAAAPGAPGPPARPACRGQSTGPCLAPGPPTPPATRGELVVFTSKCVFFIEDRIRPHTFSALPATMHNPTPMSKLSMHILPVRQQCRPVTRQSRPRRPTPTPLRTK